MKHNLKDHGVDGIYVVHAKKGYEFHENRINRIFGELEMQHEFVTDGDISNFTPELLQKYFSEDIYSKLSQGVLSCTLNHIFCYEKLVQNQNKYALVFENDVIFLGDFLSSMTSVIKEADQLKPGFILSLDSFNIFSIVKTTASA